MTVGGIQVLQGCGRGREGLGKCGRKGGGGGRLGGMHMYTCMHTPTDFDSRDKIGE